MNFDREPVIDNACLAVLEAVKDFTPEVALRALDRAAHLLNYAQRAKENGDSNLLAFVPDPDDMEDTPGLAVTLGALLDVSRCGDECDFLTAAGIASACLKAKLNDSAAGPVQ